MSFSYTTEKDNQILKVSIQGNLINKQQTQELMNEIDFHYNSGLKKLIIDMTNMKYMNSTGLSILINIFTQTRNRGGEVVIVNIPEKIEKLLVITKLNSIFNIENSIEDAKKILV